jgi:hypothetical protein
MSERSAEKDALRELVESGLTYAEAVLVHAAREVLALHHREVEKGALVEVEGGRATVREDVDYCAECGDLTGICPTAQLLEQALAGYVTPPGNGDTA